MILGADPYSLSVNISSSSSTGSVICDETIVCRFTIEAFGSGRVCCYWGISSMLFCSFLSSDVF